jgi:hypothetical protein
VNPFSLQQLWNRLRSIYGIRHPKDFGVKTRMKPKLNVNRPLKEAAKFAEVESTHTEPSLYGVTDGKVVGTYLEHKFIAYKEVWEFGDFQTPDSLASEAIEVIKRLGFSPQTILADVERYLKWRHLRGTDSAYTWRSGIKHDCAETVELERREKSFYNRRGIAVDIEDRYVSFAGQRKSLQDFVIQRQLSLDIAENTP